MSKSCGVTAHEFTSTRRDIICSEADIPVIDIAPKAWAEISALILASPTTEFSVYGSTEIVDGKTYLVHSIIVPRQTRSGAHVDAEFPCTEHAAEVVIGRGYWTHFHSHHTMKIGFSAGDDANSSINNKAVVLLYTDKAPIGEAQVLTPCGKLARSEALILVGGEDIFQQMDNALCSKEIPKSSTTKVAKILQAFPDTDGPNWASLGPSAATDVTLRYSLTPVKALVPKTLRDIYKNHHFFLDERATWALFIYEQATCSWKKVDSDLKVEDVARLGAVDKGLDAALGEVVDIDVDKSSDIFTVYNKAADLPKITRTTCKAVNNNKGPFVAKVYPYKQAPSNETSSFDILGKNKNGVWVEYTLGNSTTVVYGKLVPAMLDAITA